MEFFSLVSVYVLLFGVVLFVLLFGESEMFEGTAIETCHWVISEGPCVGFSWILRKALGKTLGTRVETAVDEWLCNRPNPAMQLVYVVLVMVRKVYHVIVNPFPSPLQPSTHARTQHGGAW